MQQERQSLDFRELLPDLSHEQAVLEANRCLYCFEAPCREGCPAQIDIPHFIQSIRSDNLKRAARIINDSNPLGSVCGRVCPVERLCESKCTVGKIGKPVSIARLQRFAMDQVEPEPQPVAKNGRKIAVVGSGPAGLACARELARSGYDVTVFESKSKAGGMVAFGVPQYRCPHKVTAREVERIEAEGVEIKTSTPVNQDVNQLFELGYEAVFLAVGLTKTSRPDMPGLQLKGVYMGLDFLNRIGASDPPEVGKRVIVVGGGDTALDCARSALRYGAEEATIMYRRSIKEMPADKVEIEEALDEGVVFRTLTQPSALHGDDNGILRAVEAVNIKFGMPDESGRKSPKEIKGSNYRLPCNTFIFATGSEPSGLLRRLIPNAEFNGKYPVVDPDTLATSISGVFCGGDVVNRGATVVQAVAEGKKAAESIVNYLEQLEDKGPITAEVIEIEEETADEASFVPKETVEVATALDYDEPDFHEDMDESELAALSEEEPVITITPDEEDRPFEPAVSDPDLSSSSTMEEALWRQDEQDAETAEEEEPKIELGSVDVDSLTFSEPLLEEEQEDEVTAHEDSMKDETPEEETLSEADEEEEAGEAEEEDEEDFMADSDEKARRREELKLKWREKLRKRKS